VSRKTAAAPAQVTGIHRDAVPATDVTALPSAIPPAPESTATRFQDAFSARQADYFTIRPTASWSPQETNARIPLKSPCRLRFPILHIMR